MWARNASRGSRICDIYILYIFLWSWDSKILLDRAELDVDGAWLKVRLLDWLSFDNMKASMVLFKCKAGFRISLWETFLMWLPRLICFEEPSRAFYMLNNGLTNTLSWKTIQRVASAGLVQQCEYLSWRHQNSTCVLHLVIQCYRHFSVRLVEQRPLTDGLKMPWSLQGNQTHS
jgi:hypothetical protein